VQAKDEFAAHPLTDLELVRARAKFGAQGNQFFVLVDTAGQKYLAKPNMQWIVEVIGGESRELGDE
jgi:hypothetical protein